MIRTPRLTLIPADLSLALAEANDRVAFTKLLAATVPAAWPPENAADALPWFIDQLTNDPTAVGWLAWYVLLDEPPGRVLAAGCGFMGRPVEGTVMVGYSVLPEFRRRGIAAEMVGTVIGWAFGHPEVERVQAETAVANAPSVKLLTRLGFRPTGGRGEEGEHFVLERGHWRGRFGIARD